MCCTGNGVSATAGVDGAGVGPGRSEELEVNVSVKDGGMMLVTALTPDLRWQSGAAELSMRVHGSPSHPQVIQSWNGIYFYFYTPTCQKRQGAPADKLHIKAAKILPLVGLARSKQDPINRGHGAQSLFRHPPAGVLE